MPDKGIYQGICLIVSHKSRRRISAYINHPIECSKEAAWLTAFLDEREKAMQKGPFAKLYPIIKKRIDRLRQLIKAGDWELQSIETPNKSVETDAQQAAPPSP